MFGIAYTLWYRYADRNQNLVIQELEELRSQGVPVDNETLQAWYERNTDPTDTAAWLEVFAQLEADSFRAWSQGLEEFDPKAVGTSWTPEGWVGEQKTRALMLETTELRNQIRELARKRTPVRFPIQFDSINTQLQSVQSMRNLARLVNLEFQAAAADRNSPALLAAIQTEFDLSLAIQKCPSLVSALVRTALRRQGLHLLKLSLEQNLLAEKELETLAQSLPREPLEVGNWKEIMQGEMAMMLPMFFDLNRYQETRTTLRLRAAYQDIWNYMDFMRRTSSVDPSSVGKALSECQAIEDQLMRDVKAAGILGMREWMVTGLSAPATATAFEVFCDERVRVGEAMHALAIRSYQIRSGSFPPNLDALRDVGFDPSDWPPIGSKPMGYRIDDGNAILWTTMIKDGVETASEPPDMSQERPHQEERAEHIWTFIP